MTKVVCVQFSIFKGKHISFHFLHIFCFMPTTDSDTSARECVKQLQFGIGFYNSHFFLKLTFVF